MTPGKATSTSAKPPDSLTRLMPLLVLVVGFVTFFAFGLERYITFTVLRENREALLAWVPPV